MGLRLGQIRSAGALVLAGMSATAVRLLCAAMPVGTGFASKYICSSVFVSGRDERAAFTQDAAPINPFFRLVSYEVDRQAKAVEADALGLFRSRSIYRQRCGCTLVGDTTAADLHNQPIASIEKDHRNYYDFLRRELFHKIGMYGAVMEADPSGTSVGSSYALATPRGWTRFGRRISGATGDYYSFKAARPREIRRDVRPHGMEHRGVYRRWARRLFFGTHRQLKLS